MRISMVGSGAWEQKSSGNRALAGFSLMIGFRDLLGRGAVGVDGPESDGPYVSVRLLPGTIRLEHLQLSRR